MNVRDLLARTRILLDADAGSKTELVSVLARFLASACGLNNPDIVVQRMLEREGQVSTGIGLGIAIPHCRLDGLESACLIAARTARDIDYDSIDEIPVRLVFMMASPTNTVAQHGEILSRLSRILSDSRTREKLLAATTTGEFLEAVVSTEEQLA